MTGYAAAQVLLSIPALVLFVLNAVAGTLVVIVVGIPILMLTLPASRGSPTSTAGWLPTCWARPCRRRTARPVASARWSDFGSGPPTR